MNFLKLLLFKKWFIVLFLALILLLCASFVHHYFHTHKQYALIVNGLGLQRMLITRFVKDTVISINTHTIKDSVAEFRTAKSTPRLANIIQANFWSLLQGGYLTISADLRTKFNIDPIKNHHVREHLNQALSAWQALQRQATSLIESNQTSIINDKQLNTLLELEWRAVSAQDQATRSFQDLITHDNSLQQFIFTVLLTSLLIGYIALALLSRQKISNELKEKTKQLSLILNSIGDGVYGLDVQGHTTFVNPSAEKMVGYNAQEMRGKLQHDLIHHHRMDGSIYPKEHCNIYQALKDGKIHTEHHECFWKKDGRSFPVEYTSTPMLDEHQAIVGAVVVFRDISERFQAEENQQKLLALLTHSNEQLEQFAYMASHDLKSPLRALAHLMQWIEQDLSSQHCLPDTVKEHLQLAHIRVNRMQQLLDDLLAYGRLPVHTQLTELVDTVNGQHLLDEVLRLLDINEQIQVESKGLDRLIVNRMPLQQIFLNLINNAIKHHDQAEKHIGVFADVCADHYSIRVKDDGPGIDFQYQQKIFEMFSTIKSKDDAEGSGVGLAFVKKAVQAHGFDISVQSVPGQGSIFTFQWPKLEVPDQI